jgi:Arc/MetJ-type ribon-helix-helix transcriptional regulator
MSERITVRLDEECKKILADYCERNQKERAEAIRDGIRKLEEK